MITKEKLKQTIELIIELNGSLTLSYVPSSDLQNTKGPYGWYYGGSSKIEISREFYKTTIIKDIPLGKFIYLFHMSIYYFSGCPWYGVLNFYI